MVNYGKGKIYKIEPICDHDDDEIYFGSTSKKYLSQRMESHRRDYKRWKNGQHNKLTVFNLFDKYGIENCKIYLVENYPCDSKEELESREGYYIKNNVCVNKYVAGRTREEYYNDNKEKIQKYGKEYKLKNSDIIKVKNKEYKLKNKDKISQKFHCKCGGKYCFSAKARHNKSLKHKKYQKKIDQLAALNKMHNEIIKKHKQLYF
jgi:hypothetical protein